MEYGILDFARAVGLDLDAGRRDYLEKLAAGENSAGRDADGLTDCNIAYALWKTMLNPRQQVIFTSRDDELAGKASSRMYDMLDMLPDILTKTVKSKTKRDIRFANGSGLRFSAQKPADVLGIDGNIWIAEDFTGAGNYGELVKSVYPVVSSHEEHQIIIVYGKTFSDEYIDDFVKGIIQR